VSQLLVELARQAEDYGRLQFSSLGFFTLCALEGLAVRRRLMPGQKPAFVQFGELFADMFYWLLMPTVRVLSRIVSLLLIAGIGLLFGMQRDAHLLDGFGPLARQPRVLIIAELILLMDLSTYWTHRLFHTVPFFWRFHAVHHSASHIRWSTTGRNHPLNEMANYLVTIVPFAAIGFPVSAVLPVTPMIVAYAICAHTDWDTAYGPLSGVMVSPRLHRWHHTPSHEGGNKNFANIFAFWDRLFGTYYLPADRLPEKFGLDVDDMPRNYLGQLLYPWRRCAPGSAAAPAGRSSEMRETA
jgi:sterol desaturase/sphingolipid hydroxylase (fatty acid hydroxylase superfamily)